METEESINEEGLKPTSIRLPKTLKKRLAQACLDKEMQKTEAIIEAIEMWVSRDTVVVAPAPSPTLSPSKREAGRNAEWHSKLDVILDHGDEDDRKGIQANLRWGAESVEKKMRGKRPEKKAG
jgi:hypothetical protein